MFKNIIQLFTIIVGLAIVSGVIYFTSSDSYIGGNDIKQMIQK